MARLKKIKMFRRMEEVPVLACRVKVFGSDANITALICGDCGHGATWFDWTPTIKKSKCPDCGNREGHLRKNMDYNPVFESCDVK